MQLLSGIASGATIGSGGTEIVSKGGTAIGATVAAGGRLIVGSGGAVELIGGLTTSQITLSTGAIVEVGSGYSLGNFNVSKGITAQVLAGGTQSGGAILQSGVLDILSGGLGSGITVSSGGKALVFFGGTDVGAAILKGGTVIVSSGGLDSGAVIGSGGTELVSAGGTAVAGATIGSGALLETASGGTAIVSGTVFNSGQLIASGVDGLVRITGGAVVSGGAVTVGNGIVDVRSGGSAKIAFLSTGSGGLEIADTNLNSSTFNGTVSDFGGVNHANHKQFIDLVSVSFASNTISFSYVSSASHTSGTLFVSSGGSVVAAINMIGAYTSKSFSATADGQGNVEIIDPAVPNGGSVELGAAGASIRDGIDLPNVAFGAHTTLAYSQNAAGTGGTLTVSDGRHAASIALLGSYIAGSFVTAADGHGGTLVAQTQTEQQLLLAHPPHR